MFSLYLVVALGAIGILCWALYQAAIRHRQLRAELERLERLAAEVTLHAEAVLDRVDDRIERLEHLAIALEHKAAVSVVLQAPEAPAAGSAVAPPVVSGQVLPPQAPAPGRYQELKTRVEILADQGRSAGEIAEAVGRPRGEVTLILNLRKRKATA